MTWLSGGGRSIVSPMLAGLPPSSPYSSCTPPRARSTEEPLTMVPVVSFIFIQIHWFPNMARCPVAAGCPYSPHRGCSIEACLSLTVRDSECC